MTSKAFGLAQLGNAFDDGALSNRNLIINGAMQVAQRGTSLGTLSTNNYLLDRFSLSRFGGYPDNATQSQDSDAPSGFTKSFKMVRNSAHTLTGTNASAFIQVIEGQNMAHLNWGTSAAQPVTVSFWVKSNQTGNFPFIMADAGSAYDIGKLYTISAANTWEYKTITIDGPTAGTFNTDNTAGAYLYWGFGAVDAARTAQGTTWGASNSAGSSKSMVTGASVALAETNGATWQITGVQLEVGDTATPFEHRSYGQELALCQRYYQHNLTAAGGAGSSTQSAHTIVLSPQMRSTPTMSLISGTSALDELYTSRRNISTISGPWGENDQTKSIGVLCNTSGLTAQRFVTLFSGVIALDAEL